MSHPFTSILTINETHMFGTAAAERGAIRPEPPRWAARFRRRRSIRWTSASANGVTRPIGLPQMIVAGDLNFGGPGTLPQGRIDTSYVFDDTFSHAARPPLDESSAASTGTSSTRTSPRAPACSTSRAWPRSWPERPMRSAPRSASGEASSTSAPWACSSRTRSRSATASRSSSGLRYEWHVTPTERDDRFVVFDAASASLVRVGVDVDEIYQQNNGTSSRALGLAWNLSPDGRTVLRAAYGRAVGRAGHDGGQGHGRQSAVRDAAHGGRLDSPRRARSTTTRPAGLAPATVDPRFRNASMQSWNVNVQRQLARDLAVTRRLFGLARREPSHLAQYQSAGRRRAAVPRRVGLQPDSSRHAARQHHPGGEQRLLELQRARGWPSPSACRAVCSSTPRTPGRSRSTPTRSIRPASPSRTATTFPTSTGLSDFDARHRFVLSATYALPFTGHVLTRGWQLATVVQSQSGNPVNIVTSNSSLNGVPNSVRPDVTGPIRIIGSVDQWFDPSAFVAANHFGNLGRNVVIGPGFNNTDLSLIKNARPGGRLGLQFRVDVFDRVQPSQLRPAGQHRRQPDVRQDHEDAPAHRRSRLLPPDSAGRAIVVLRWRCECVRASSCSRSPRRCVRARDSCRARQAQVVSPRTVLTIHSGAESFPSNPILDAGIRESLRRAPTCRLTISRSTSSPISSPSEQASLAFKDYIQAEVSRPQNRPGHRDDRYELAVRPGPPRRVVSGCAGHFLRARRPGRDHPPRRRRHHRNHESALHTPRR